MNIDHLKLFVRLASTHNIRLAGSEVGVSAAVASTYLNKLESGLGVRLVHRTTRKVSLTEEGEAFLPHAEDVLASIEAAEISVGVGNALPSGTLRVAAPASFGRMHLMPGVKSFLSHYPDLSVDFRFSDSIVDLVEGGFDIAIRNAVLEDSTLVARKLAPDKRIVCASPEYLDKHGEPKSPEDLMNHECIILKGLGTWEFELEQGRRALKVRGRFQSDNGDVVREACVDGLGISIISTWSAYKELSNGNLVEVLSEFPLVSNTAIWAVYPSNRLIAPKVRAFIDHFASQFSPNPYWELNQ